METSPAADLAASLRENLETRGVFARVSAFIHAEVMKTLLAIDPSSVQLSPDRHLVNALISEYLKSAGYIATLSVFNDENGSDDADCPDLCSLTGTESTAVLGRSIGSMLARETIRAAVQAEAQQLDGAIAGLVENPVGAKGSSTAAFDPLPALIPARAPEFRTVLRAHAQGQGDAVGGRAGKSAGKVQKRGGRGLLDLDVVRVELGLEGGLPTAQADGASASQTQGTSQPLLLELVQRAKAGRYREMMAGVESDSGQRVLLYPQGPYAGSGSDRVVPEAIPGVTGPMRVVRKDGSYESVQAGGRVLPARGLALAKSGPVVASAPAPAQQESGVRGSWTPGPLSFVA